MKIDKIRTFYRLRFRPDRYDSDLANLRMSLIKAGAYFHEYEDTYKALCQASRNDLTDVKEYLEKHHALAEIREGVLEAEFIRRNGKSKRMPMMVRWNLLGDGMEIEKVIVVKNLDSDQFFRLQNKAFRRKKRLLLPSAEGVGLELLYVDKPYGSF